ncbi:MAG: prfA, partial [Actinomycetia bacterium]|nr:prfA [Actinomycetes bacterium]
MLDRLAALEDEFRSVEARLSDPKVFEDNAAYVKLTRRHRELEPIVAAVRARTQASEDLAAAKEMLDGTSGDDREMVRAELAAAEEAIARIDEELKVLLLPRDPNDGRNVIVEIRGAEGGEEANLFARDLYDMYVAYAGRQGWKLEVMDSS